MKNVFFALAFMLISSFTFANNTEVNNLFTNTSSITINGITFSKSLVKENDKLCNENVTKLPFCRVSCSANIGGVTFSASGGNFLSSCERAGRRCAEKLGRAIRQFLQAAPTDGGGDMPIYT